SLRLLARPRVSSSRISPSRHFRAGFWRAPSTCAAGLRGCELLQPVDEFVDQAPVGALEEKQIAIIEIGQQIRFQCFGRVDSETAPLGGDGVPEICVERADSMDAVDAACDDEWSQCSMIGGGLGSEFAHFSEDRDLATAAARLSEKRESSGH